MMAASRDEDSNGQEASGGGGGGGMEDGRNPREDTPPAPCAAFCGPRSCSTMPPSLSAQHTQEMASEPKRRRLWGLRGLVKMFRRRVRRRAGDSASPQPPQPTLRARSTSELAVDHQSSRSSSGPYNQVLSVSHDSVFTPDTATDGHHHAHSTPPALAIATRGVNMAELKAALRRRRGDDSGGSGDDDPGLPRSPPTSPTTLDVLNHGLKSCSRATQSTCSDGSLLSMGSSENDEDSLGPGSHHSSKISLQEGRHQVVGVDGDKWTRPVRSRVSTRLSFVSDTIIDGRNLYDLVLDDQDDKNTSRTKDNEPVAGAVPLSHQAALHKISVRPRRTHGVPRSRRATQIGGQMSLPVTPEVNEDSSNKSVTPSKSSLASSPSPITSTPVHSVSEEHINGSPEVHASVERRDSEKKEKDEKRDEPLLQRLFGSVRSGRRRSRGSGDDSRENSISPLRRGGDQRASREKRRDSSGSKFPGLGRASTKTRQESHPLPPSGRTRELSRDRASKEVSPSSPQAVRSASVEGRLESTSPGHQKPFRISSYDERPSRPAESVRKVKSFKEVPGQIVTEREVSYYRTTQHTNAEEKGGDGSPEMSHLSASLDSLGDEKDTRTSSKITSSSGSSEIETTSSPQRSSTDSLTATPLPGIFIRQQPQGQHKSGLQKQQESLQKVPHYQHGGQDTSSGPLSLDSSMTLHPRDSEEHLRKASSVDHVSYAVDIRHHKRESEMKEIVGKKVKDVKLTVVSKTSVEEKSDLMKYESSKSSAQIIRSQSLQATQGSGPQQVHPEDGEAESEKAPTRPLRKEPSMKRIPPRDLGPTPVPEFMRIQLNRVESKGHSVIYDTEQEKQSKLETKDTEIKTDYKETEIVNGQFESPVVVAVMSQKELHSSEQKTEDSSSLKKDVSNIISAKESRTPTTSLKKRNSGQFGKSIFRDSSPGGNIDETSDKDSGVEGTSPESSIDRVVLRKPLVSERAPVMERAHSITSQTTPSPSKGQQPELFEVFARRSFKVKDSDKEKLQVSDSEEEKNVEASSEVAEITVTPTRTLLSSSPSPVSQSVSATPVSSTTSMQGLQKPSLNSISFNRKSVGNPALSFCPPPVASPGSPLSPKPTMLILPDGSSQDANFTGVPPSTSSSPQNVTTITTTSSPSIISSSPSSKSVTTPVHVSVQPNDSTPVTVPSVHSSVTVSSTYSGGIASKIISNRVISAPSTSDGSSGNEGEISPTVVTSTPSKPVAGSRSGTSIIWPPRPQQVQQKNETQVSDSQQTLTSTTASSSETTHQQKTSTSVSMSDSDGTQAKQADEKQLPVEMSPLDIGAARRRFMSGGKDRPLASVSPLVQNVSPTLPTSGIPVTIASTSGTPSVSIKSGPITETRNSTPTFTITVRTQSAPATTNSDTPLSSTSVSTANTDLNSSVTSTGSSSSSIGKLEHGATAQAAEDWRVLVRQRREGRLKQTKTPDSEEIIIETRPPVSRNSKVLEMANNFQKLQVA